MLRTLKINWPIFQMTKLKPRIFYDFVRVSPLTSIDTAKISVQINNLSKKKYFMFAINRFLGHVVKKV